MFFRYDGRSPCRKKKESGTEEERQRISRKMTSLTAYPLLGKEKDGGRWFDHQSIKQCASYVSESAIQQS